MTTEPAQLAGISVLWCRFPGWKFFKWSRLPGEWTKRETGQRVTHCSCASLLGRASQPDKPGQPGSCDQVLTVNCIVTQLMASESFGICHFRGSCMREYDSKGFKNNCHAHSLHVKMLASVPFTVRTWKNATRLRDHFAQWNLQWNYASFNVTLTYIMYDHGILRDIFLGFRQRRAKRLSNSCQ